MLIFVFSILVILWRKFLFVKETRSLTCHKSTCAGENWTHNFTDCISRYKSTIRQVPYSIQEQDLSLQKIILNPCLIPIMYLQLWQCLYLTFIWPYLFVHFSWPDKITLWRGNHESRQITQIYGFYGKVNKKGGFGVEHHFQQYFSYNVYWSHFDW